MKKDRVSYMLRRRGDKRVLKHYIDIDRTR